MRIATAYRKLGQYTNALKYLQKAEHLFSSNYSRSRIYLNRCIIYRELEQTDQMEKTLNTLKSIIPAEEFIFQTAVLHITRNEFNQVLNILDTYKTAKPKPGKSSRAILITKAAIEGELNPKFPCKITVIVTRLVVL